MALIIGLSGIDGSGKTTAAVALEQKLRKSGRKVLYHHEIDFILLKPIFKIFMKMIGKNKANDLKENLLNKTENGVAFYSDIYYIAVWFDNLIAYIYFKLRRGIVIHDRWIYDFSSFFDHKYYYNKYVTNLYMNFPRPDLLILLTVPPEIAIVRKENDAAHIDHDIDYYRGMERKLFENADKWKWDNIISSNQAIENIVNEIATSLDNK